ncbi:receptor expression-enhancing protein 2-like [Ornithodoros turicata]|uniref:receptor expression-enhancing protein 2-like n=1 Tax=Ornithodoros turicata TaxID=34597 RepID=UPI003138AC99
MVSVILSRLVILIFGTLYPAYASYKAVKTKNVREYVKWMMYWIVFALFTCAETFADLLVAFWFPFYYELKVLFVLWLLSPATKGSSILYRKFVHPQLLRREEEIDQFLLKARDQGYTAVAQLGSKGLSYAAGVVMHTALKGQETLVSHLHKADTEQLRKRSKKLESDTSSESSKSHGEGPRRSTRKRIAKDSPKDS